MAKSCIIRKYKDYDEIKEYPSWKQLEKENNLSMKWKNFTAYKGVKIEALINILEKINKNFKVKILSLTRSKYGRIAKIKLVKK